MKLRIREQVFLPVLLILVLLTVTTYLVFSMTVERYMQEESQREIRGLLLAVSPFADRVFRVPDDLDTITPAQLALVEQAQATDFSNRARPLIKNSASDAHVLVLDREFFPIYPKLEEMEGNDSTVYQFLFDRMQENQLNAFWDEAQQITLNDQQFLVALQEMEEKSQVRARYVIVYNPVFDTSALLGGAAQLVLLITTSLAVLSLVAMWVIAGSISRPIRQLCEHAIRIGSGDFHHIESKTKVKELAELTDAMNEMSQQLERSDTAQKTFFQNASHELRTPLMSITGYAQGIQYGVFPDNSEAAGIIMSESMRLTELVDGILTLSRMDNRHQALNLHPVELNDFLGDVIKKLEGMALKREISLSFHPCTQSVYVRADQDLLLKAFTNVTSNCLRYASKEVQVSILLDQPEWATIQVQDDGPGFSQEDAPHLFERFYKGKGGNFGIGLSIAKSSMEYMGGTIGACNTGHGASFSLHLKCC